MAAKRAVKGTVRGAEGLNMDGQDIQDLFWAGRTTENTEYTERAGGGSAPVVDPE